jgi:HSP20 family molecular chaperone IbpA
MIELILKHHPGSQNLISIEALTGNNEVQRWRYQHRQGVWRPLTDVYENEEAIVVSVEIGGMREEDFSIYLEEQRLLIQGNRTDTLERVPTR